MKPLCGFLLQGLTEMYSIAEVLQTDANLSTEKRSLLLSPVDMLTPSVCTSCPDGLIHSCLQHNVAVHRGLTC